MLGLFNLKLWQVKPRLVKSPYDTEVVVSWTNPTYELMTYKVHMEPITTTDGTYTRPQTITQYRLITPPGINAAFNSEDRLFVEKFTSVTTGAYWKVVGVPGQFHTPFLAHSEFIVEKVEG